MTDFEDSERQAALRQASTEKPTEPATVSPGCEAEQWASLLLAAQQMLAEGDHGAVRRLSDQLQHAASSATAEEAPEAAEVLSSVATLHGKVQPDILGLIAGAIAVIGVLLLLTFVG